MDKKEICAIVKAVAQGMLKACDTMEQEETKGDEQ